MIEISEKEFLSGKHDTLILNELAKDNLIIFPSESVYGFAGIASSKKVCDKIHSAKKEEKDKLIGVITDDPKKVEAIADITRGGRQLLETNFGSPLTIIFKAKEKIPFNNTGFAAVRIPLNKSALQLCQLVDGPLTAPSANIHGKPAIFSPSEIKKYFGDKKFVFINGGELETRAPSTYYGFEENEIFRAGDISLEEIEKVLGKE